MEPTADPLLLQLEILRAVSGTSAVRHFGVEGDGRPQDYGVYLEVQPPDPNARKKPIRVPCSKSRTTVLQAALDAKKSVAAIVGEDAVEQAERLVMERQAAAGGLTAPSTAFDVLALTQKLRAVVKSAELRATAAEQRARQVAERAAAEAAASMCEPEAARQAAWQELEAARAALDAHHLQQQPKRQRVEGEAGSAEAAGGAEAAGSAEAAPEVAEPAWRKRPYAKYNTIQKWIDREGELWNRRRVKLSADKAGRLPAKLPRGDRNGPLHHSTRVSCVQCRAGRHVTSS